MKKNYTKLTSLFVAVILVAFSSPASKQTYSGRPGDEKNEEVLACYYYFAYCNGVAIPILCNEPCYENDPFGCPDVGTFTCAKAFMPADTETYMENGICKRRPKAGATAYRILLKPDPC